MFLIRGKKTNKQTDVRIRLDFPSILPIFETENFFLFLSSYSTFIQTNRRWKIEKLVISLTTEDAKKKKEKREKKEKEKERRRRRRRRRKEMRKDGETIR